MADAAPLSPDVLQALAGSKVILTPTDAGREDNFGYTREAAARLAAALNAELVLYDRSAATWGDTPHQEQACDAARAEELGHDELVQQFADMERLGARNVRAYLASMPTWDGVENALRDTGADVIVTPTGLDHPKFTDRFTIPGGDLVGRLRRYEGPVKIVVAERDGSVSVV
ncbi:MAG: hypothetical protein ACK5RL_21155 [Acidimicrobiales bacterium]